MFLPPLQPGETFHSLTVIASTDLRIGTTTLYLTVCKCGESRHARASDLRHGKVKACKSCASKNRGKSACRVQATKPPKARRIRDAIAQGHQTRTEIIEYLAGGEATGGQAEEFGDRLGRAFETGVVYSARVDGVVKFFLREG